jgi:hypothetical protein
LSTRGNSGGNKTWLIQWLKALAGRRHESVFISSERHNKTTRAGRADGDRHVNYEVRILTYDKRKKP